MAIYFDSRLRLRQLLFKNMAGTLSELRILVVDDESAIRDMLRFILETEDWTVEATASGEEALERWRTFDPDVVLIDQMLPGISGLELAKTLRAEGFEKPLLLFSGFLTAKLEAQAESLSMRPLPKSEVRRLVETVKEIAASAA